MRESDYVVDFTLPEDEGLFIHHGINVTARNAKEARAKFAAKYPQATIIGVCLGMVCLYGDEYSTWDASLGAECAPARKEIK